MYVKSSHLIEAATYQDFGREKTESTTLTYTNVTPITTTGREILAGGFALILTTPYLHIHEVWINCLATNFFGGYIFVDYEGIVGGPGVLVDTAVFVGQTLVLTDLITPSEGGFPFFIVTVPGVNDTASFVYQIFGTSIL